MAKVPALYCKSCNYVIFSRWSYDCRWCPCRTIFIDGGPEMNNHQRFGGGEDFYKVGNLDIGIVSKLSIQNMTGSYYKDQVIGVDDGENWSLLSAHPPKGA